MGMSEQQLLEIDGHMRARDHLNDGTPWDELWRDVYSQLADDVPELVTEVRRLRAMLVPLAESLLATARRNGVREQDTIDVGRLTTSLSELHELLNGPGEQPDTTSSP